MQGPWFDRGAYDGNHVKEKTVDIAEVSAQRTYGERAAQLLQDSPGRQALVQMANYNKFLDALSAAVKAMATLDGDHQELALTTLSGLVRVNKGTRG